MVNNTGQRILSTGDIKDKVNALISAETVCGIAVQINWTVLTFAVALQPKTILGRFFVEVSRIHTDTSGKTLLNEWSASRRSHYLHNTHQTQETNIAALTGTGTCNPRNRAAPVIRFTAPPPWWLYWKAGNKGPQKVCIVNSLLTYLRTLTKLCIIRQYIDISLKVLWEFLFGQNNQQCRTSTFGGALKKTADNVQLPRHVKSAR